VTPDGANTFHSRTQISIGIKITDTRALHCKTKAPVFVPVLDDDVGDGTVTVTLKVCNQVKCA
jgi:hypothetical protein